MDTDLFQNVIQNLLRVNVMCIEGEQNALKAFQDKYCFHTALQPMFTAQALSLLLDSIRDQFFYEIVDILDVCLLLFRIENRIFLVGPYVKHEYEEKKSQRILVRNNLPASYAISLKLYYTAHPLLSIYHIQQVIEACVKSFFPHLPSVFQYRRLQGFQEEFTQEKPSSRFSDYSTIIRTYDTENHFMDMIRAGNEEGVIAAFSAMQSGAMQSMDSGNLEYSKRNPLATLSILRTLARKAAESGGVSVIAIDQITQTAIQRITATPDFREQSKYTTEMILELTRAVHEQKIKKNIYSEPVSKCIEYLRLYFSREVSVRELAALVHVSESHLARQFKKETGSTIHQYLTMLRLEEAEGLLKKNELTIQEISAYVGYPDNNYFVKVFKKAYGITPSLYRKDHIS